MANIFHKPSVIFDVDGTLCDVSAIRHYVEGKRRNFAAFHKASLFCPPRPEVAMMWEAAGDLKYHRLVVTGRDARFERVTRDWLLKHGFTPDKFYCRPWGDGRPDTVVKAEILERILDDGFVPELAIDDRADIAEVWEAAGIKCVLV